MTATSTKKALSIILVVLMLLSTLTMTSCNRKFDEAEVISEAKRLLKTAEMLNVVYYGSGIEYIDSEAAIGYYKEAERLHLETLGFHTIGELKEITEQTFSAKYTNTVYTTILSSMKDGITVISNARYYQVYHEETNEPIRIMVNTNFTPMLKGPIEYDYDSMRVEGSKKEKVNLLVDATVSNSEGETQTVTVKVSLVEEENGWRIDAPTYANYNSLAQQYEELQNQDIKK